MKTGYDLASSKNGCKPVLGGKRERYLNPRHLTSQKEQTTLFCQVAMISSCKQWVDRYVYWFADQPDLVFVYFYLRQNIILPVHSRACRSPSIVFHLLEALEQAQIIYQPRFSPSYVHPSFFQASRLSAPGSSLISLSLVPSRLHQYPFSIHQSPTEYSFGMCLAFISTAGTTSLRGSPFSSSTSGYAIPSTFWLDLVPLFFLPPPSVRAITTVSP